MSQITPRRVGGVRSFSTVLVARALRPRLREDALLLIGASRRSASSKARATWGIKKTLASFHTPVASLSLPRPADGPLRRVADGIGITPADRQQLFREFFRSESPEVKAQPGTGLGLTIVDRIVTRHLGRIEVESVLGEGSTFRVFLPGD